MVKLTESKKLKKHERIMLELKRRRRVNDTYCDINSCDATEYMNGSNDTLNALIDFVENL